MVPEAFEFSNTTSNLKNKLHLTFWVDWKVIATLLFSVTFLDLRYTFYLLSINISRFSNSYSLIGHLSVLPMSTMPISSMHLLVIW